MKSERDARREQRADLRSVLASPSGRRLLWRVIDEMGGFMRWEYSANGSDMNRILGRRQVGHELAVECQKADHHLYNIMIAEQLSAAEAELARARSSSSKPTPQDNEENQDG